jgi:spermidine synthase
MENKKKKSIIPFLLLDIGVSVSAVLIFIIGFLRGFGMTGIFFINKRINLFFAFFAVLVFMRIFLSFFRKVKIDFPSFFKITKRTDEYRPVYIGIFLVSASVLMLEILLTRIYSVTLFYHFAFMAISVAIFGGALSGVVVYLLPRLFKNEKARIHLSITALLLAFTSVAGVVIQLHFKIAEKYSPLSARLLIISYLISAVPFFFGGLAITLGLTHFTRKVSRIYFSDLLGAGIGCLMILAVLNLFDAPSAVFIVASVAAAAGFFFFCSRNKKTFDLLRKSLLILSLMFFVCGIVNNDLKIVRVINSKGRKINLDKVLLEKWNSFSCVSVYNQYHRDWSLSRQYKGDVLNSIYMDIDALASTPIINFRGITNTAEYLKWELTYTAFLFNEKPAAFIIGPGGGRDIATALVAGARKVDAVEINPIIVNDVMLGLFKKYSGGIYEYPRVSVEINDARSSIRSSTEKYDVILASLVDTWAASSAGAYNLSENNLYTVEAFTDFYNHLNANGILSIERWDSESLRLATVANEMAKKAGIDDVSNYIVMVAVANLNNFLLKKTPWRPEEIEKLNDWCRERGFWVLWDPISRYEHHPIGKYLCRKPDARKQFVDGYIFDISPTYDNKPFFFQKEKQKTLAGLIGHSLKKGLFFKGKILFNKGVSSLQYFLLWIALLVLLVIIIPLFVLKKKKARQGFLNTIAPLTYFSFLGLGFIFIEMALMQKFILFLGHPVFALSVVLFSLLVFCGIGSRFTEKWARIEKRPLILRSIPAVVLIHLLFLFTVTPLFYSLISLPAFIRTVISVILLLIPAFVMGMPMPLGIKYLNEHNKELIPWAWALNGSFSVLGSVLATYFAIVKGFNFAYILGIMFYLVALLAAAMLKRH